MNLLMDKMKYYLDAATQFLWESFEKDMVLTESLIKRTEVVFATIEDKLFPGRRNR